MSSAVPNATTGSVPTSSAATLEAALQAQLSSNLGLNLGPFVLGLAFDTALLGIMLHQVIRWSTFSKKESTLVSCLVGFLVMISTATSGFGLAYMFHLFVYGFGTYLNFVGTHWPAWYALLDVLTTFPVQAFYVYRAYQLHQDANWIPVLVLPVMLASVAGGMATMISSERLSDVTQAAASLLSIIRPHADLTSLRSPSRNTCTFGQTELGETKSLVNKFLRINIDSLLPATLVALGFMINYAVQPSSFVNLFWEMWHPKCYIVCFLAVLNSNITLESYGNGSNGNIKSSYQGSNDHPLKSSKARHSNVQLDGITVNTHTAEEAYHTAPSKVGLNRRPLGDEEWDQKLEYAGNSSQAGYTEVPSRNGRL
ncbi:MAG: hypothetical protein TREMPRED_001197 [Tremellales sp. Tagirdzhanova-0007]|nr:MAG: hypothetical protein TREMPRED_001197 [Tremellales sp. Tagirdzhanova-0007]